MIVAKLTTDKKEDVFVLGLSKGNIRNLKKGHPAITEFPGMVGTKIIIMYGDTEADIYKELNKNFDKMPIPEIRKGMGNLKKTMESI